MTRTGHLFSVAAAALLAILSGAAAPPLPTAHSTLVYPGPNGKLVYKPYDAQGDTILDFSNCGYGGGGVALPNDVPTKITLSPETGDGDDRARVQAAIDRLAGMPLDAHGFRGALLLKKGHYRLGGPVRIAASGIVVRGEGATPDGTLLLATGHTAYPLFEVRGASGAVISRSARPSKIADAYVPVGARTFSVENASEAFKPGDTVIVRRVGNAAWIHAMGMDRIVPRGSNPGSTKQWTPFTVDADRVVTAVSGTKITLDAPIACAIDTQWGGGEVQRSNDSGRITQVGVENMYAESIFDKTKTSTVGAANKPPYFADEDHATYIVQFDNVKNAWGRHLSARYLAQGVAEFRRGAKWVTVEDCSAVDPVSIITGGRRYTYNIGGGQLILVQRCYARDARHAFIVSASHLSGPNVFLDCKAENNHATSEPHQRWSVGGLYDNVDAALAFQDRQWMGSGHGWAGGNYVVWNGQGSAVVQQPPTAQNFAIGFAGRKEKGAFPRPDGWWESPGTPVAPRSLYLAQLADRLGDAAVQNVSR